MRTLIFWYQCDWGSTPSGLMMFSHPTSPLSVTVLLISYQKLMAAKNDKKLTLDSRTNMALFRSFTASDYVAAQRLKRRAMYYHREVFKKVDVIITPTTGMTAPVIRPNSVTMGETNMEVTGNLMRFILAGNLLGLPAISVPVGYDKKGLPIGLQIIGRPWGEATILRLARGIT